MRKTMEWMEGFFQKNPAARLLILTFFVSVGVFFAHPQRGVLALLPVALVFFVLAAFASKRWYEAPAIALLVALLYGKTTAFSDTLALALGCSVAALLSYFLKLAVKGETKFGRLLSFALLPALILPIFLWGTPTTYLEKESEAQDYVEKTYPDQSFVERRFYYSPSQKGWQLEVSYAQNDGVLSSVLLFSDKGVEDGFRRAFADRAMEQRKAVLMEMLSREEGLSALVEPMKLDLPQDAILHGSFGAADPELHKNMHFSVTFRREQYSRQELVDAAIAAKKHLDENGVSYGTLSFFAQDAGIPLYRVDVTPTMTEEDILLAAKKL